MGSGRDSSSKSLRGLRGMSCTIAEVISSRSVNTYPWCFGQSIFGDIIQLVDCFPSENKSNSVKAAPELDQPLRNQTALPLSKFQEHTRVYGSQDLPSRDCAGTANNNLPTEIEGCIAN